MKTINLSKISGKKAIGSDDLVYCNTKYHAPYLAVISAAGEMDWQEKLYSGYGKHRETYYNVENLKPGDYIQAAGGSGGNKYPFKGKVVDPITDTLNVEEISDAEFSNVIAERKTKAAQTAPPSFSEDEQRLITSIKALSADRLKLVLAEASK